MLAALEFRRVLFGSAGTVTAGGMPLLDAVPAAGEDPDQVLRLGGALEEASEHPIAQAIATGATARVGTLPPVEGFANLEGLGVQGVVDGHAVLVRSEERRVGKECRSRWSPYH